MDSHRLLSVFSALGRSPKDWHSMEDDWQESFQESCKLTWPEFMTLQNHGWWKYHAQAVEMFITSFSSSFTKVEETFFAISAETEDWNDLLEFILISNDFEELWEHCWITRDDMVNSLADFKNANSDSDYRIIELKNSFKNWFESDLRKGFKDDILGILTPLKKAIEK